MREQEALVGGEGPCPRRGKLEALLGSEGGGCCCEGLRRLEEGEG